MKSWSDLSWREKRAIQEGNVNRYRYNTGYTFQVKTEVQKGQKKKEDVNNGS